jgi:hypothetical protein
MAIDLEDVALQQLEAALSHWHSKAYVPAITLAGAAEELLGKLVRSSGKESRLDEMKREYCALHRLTHGAELATDELEKWLVVRANGARNVLKHGCALDFPINLGDEARDLIDRAISNYWLLRGRVTPTMVEFERRGVAV